MMICVHATQMIIKRSKGDDWDWDSATQLFTLHQIRLALHPNLCILEVEPLKECSVVSENAAHISQATDAVCRGYCQVTLLAYFMFNIFYV